MPNHLDSVAKLKTPAFGIVDETDSNHPNSLGSLYQVVLSPGSSREMRAYDVGSANLPELSFAKLQQGLTELATKDEKLAPFLTLLGDRRNVTDITRTALHDTKAFNDCKAEPRDSNPYDTPSISIKTVPFSLIKDSATLGISEVISASQKPLPFGNWGLTLDADNFPSHQLVITKITGVQAMVKWAAENDKRVRMAGFRHTWSNLYGRNGDIIAMFQPYESVVHLPFSEPDKTWSSELVGIALVSEVAGRSPPEGHAFCKIMAGTTNQALKDFCLREKTVCIPFNIVLLEATFGGTTATISHGSGFSTSTLSDLVREVTYVDATGELQTINESHELRVASGAFGLLGIVVSLTLQLDKMEIAMLKPTKIPLPLAIPPPVGYLLPVEVSYQLEELRIKIDGPEIAKAREEFKKRCEEDYYLEFFWFPYHSHVWVNTWQKQLMESYDIGLEAESSKASLEGFERKEVQSISAEDLVNNPAFRQLDGRYQAYLVGLATALSFPTASSESYLSEALHLRRGIQDFRFWSTQWNIPIPGAKGKRDYDFVAKTWWDGITAIYADNRAPVRLGLEMRFTGSSEVILAPQRGNELGTISIEALTILTTDKELWNDFCQTIADKWTSYVDPRLGRPLATRPHWAKQWQGLEVHGVPIDDYFKDVVYKEAFEEFRLGFEDIVRKRNGSAARTLARFGDPTIAKLLFPDA